jgi:phage-related protein
MTALALPLICKITTQSTLSTSNRIISAQYGNGFEQIAPDGLNSNIDTWDIIYAPLEGTDLTTLLTFISTVDVVSWFTYTPLGESTSKKWRIVKDSIKRNMISTTKWQMSFSIKQCFDLGT